MAFFKGMEGPVVRVRLPAGPAFAAALVEAAETYAARRGFTDSAKQRFVDLVQAGLDAVSSGAPSNIELHAAEVAGGVETEIIGSGSTESIDFSAVTAMAERAGCSEFSTSSAPATVHFVVGLS